MAQTIIAMSGRKQAGKNTVGQFVCKYYAEQQFVSKVVDGRLTRTISHGNPYLFDTFECSFADSLKSFCIDVLGLPRETCYGSDEEKELPTEYEWDSVPRFLAWKFADQFARDLVTQGKTQDELMSTFHRKLFEPDNVASMTYRNGKMTGRDIMQVFGTDLIRQTFGNVWAKATIRRIKKEGKPVSVITDNRFSNEIEAVLAEPKGYIIRLTRSPFGLNDAHPSESALDKFDWNRKRCFIVDNAKMTINEQNEVVKLIMNKIFEF